MTVLDVKTSFSNLEPLKSAFSRHAKAFQDDIALAYAGDIIYEAALQADVINSAKQLERLLLGGKIAADLIDELPRHIPPEPNLSLQKTRSTLWEYIGEAWIATDNEEFESHLAKRFYGPSGLTEKEREIRRVALEDALTKGDQVKSFCKASRLLARRDFEDLAVPKIIARWIGHNASASNRILIGSVLKAVPGNVHSIIVEEAASLVEKATAEIISVVEAAYNLAASLAMVEHVARTIEITDLNNATFRWCEEVTEWSDDAARARDFLDQEYLKAKAWRQQHNKPKFRTHLVYVTRKKDGTYPLTIEKVVE